MKRILLLFTLLVTLFQVCAQTNITFCVDLTAQAGEIGFAA